MFSSFFKTPLKCHLFCEGPITPIRISLSFLLAPIVLCSLLLQYFYVSPSHWVEQQNSKCVSLIPGIQHS